MFANSQIRFASVLGRIVVTAQPGGYAGAISKVNRVINVPKKSNQSGGGVPPKRLVAVPSSAGNGFVTEFRHYRTGKWMRAKDYGLKAWPFGYGKRG